MQKIHEHKGFTMMELLIVIFTVSMLYAMSMAAFSRVKDSAKAAQIVNNLKVIKTAVMSWYIDNNMNRVKKELIDAKYIGTYKVHTRNPIKGAQFIGDYINTQEGRHEILSYINSGELIDLEAERYYLKSENNGSWYVTYMFGDNDTALKQNIAGRKDNAEFIGGFDKKTLTDEHFDPHKHNTVSIVIMNFEKSNR